ncbi:hypothetical protein FQN60_002532 [Etheostoma spectabile]|uniref:Uncharacterized protein n=1 Tax=Etheostoma spectabile TaxID=54343 RepID=A0A5J5CED5_9PERO|nr:hypothetical protein FQN60_002532 [Etheostoma spectabile]
MELKTSCGPSLSSLWV